MISSIHIKLYSIQQIKNIHVKLMAIVDSLHMPSSCLDVWSKWLKSSDTASMDFMQVNLTLFIVLGVAILWLLSWKTLKKGGNPPMPGPRGLPLVGHLPFLDRELHTYFSYLAKKYGPIVKLMLGNKVGVVISSPSLSREVLKDHDITFANRDVPPVAAMITMYGGKDIVWTSYGPEWRMLKKVSMLKMLSNTTLDSSYNLRRLELRKTINYMYNQVGSPVNIGEQMFLNSLNVITNMMWGGSVKGEERATLGTEFRQVVAEVTELLGTPNVSDFFPSLARFDLQGVEKRIKGVIPKLDRIFDIMIDQRLRIDQDRDSGNGTKDLLQYMLELKDEQDAKTPFTMSHLKAMLMEMVLGGSDTTSNTVEFAMAEIMNKPHIMRKAQQELAAIVSKNSIVEESQIHRLPYLNAIMKETLRLHPTVPLLVPHCPNQTCTIGGYTVPKGSRVFINVWAIHRDPEVWANPAEFDPERFLNSQVDFSGNDFKYFPFGSGRRICAGIGMAERMIMYSLASLLHSFDWKMPNEVKIDISEKFGMVLKMKGPLIAIPLPRLSDPALYA